MERPNRTPRILILGIDGGSPLIMNHLFERGKLPNLSSLVSTGCYGILRSTMPPITPQAWSDFMTGADAGRHGIYDFIEKKKDSNGFHFVNASFRRVKSIWRVLSDRGYRTGTVNVPFTYPPERLNGFMVCGVDAPGMEKDIASPPEILDEILGSVGEFLLHQSKPAGKDQEKYLENLKRITANLSRISLHLLETHDVDCFSVVFSASDHVQHYFWKDLPADLGGDGASSRFESAVTDIYRLIDREIGRIIDAFGETALTIVLSDHGAAPLRKTFHMNRWLHSIGLLHYRGESRSGRLPRLSGRVVSALHRQMGRQRDYLKARLGQGVKDRLKSLFPEMEERVESSLVLRDVDWRRTKAYSTGIYGNIFLNLRGREFRGIVDSGPEAAGLLDLIRTSLLAVSDPESGTPVVEDAVRGETLFTAPPAGRPPDLVPLWKGWEYCATEKNLTESDEIFCPVRRVEGSDMRLTALHHRDGLLIMKGKGLKEGFTGFTASIRDPAPTLLYLLGEPRPPHMTGTILTELVEPGFLAANPVETVLPPGEADGEDGVRTDRDRVQKDAGAQPPQREYSPEESEKIRERLKGLGYIE